MMTSPTRFVLLLLLLLALVAWPVASQEDDSGIEDDDGPEEGMGTVRPYPINHPFPTPNDAHSTKITKPSQSTSYHTHRAAIRPRQARPGSSALGWWLPSSSPP